MMPDPRPGSPEHAADWLEENEERIQHGMWSEEGTLAAYLAACFPAVVEACQRECAEAAEMRTARSRSPRVRVMSLNLDTLTAAVRRRMEDPCDD